MPRHAVRPAPEGFLSFLDALIVILEVTYPDEIARIKKKFSGSIRRSTERRGGDFPAAFVEFALCDPKLDLVQEFTEIELHPEFRNICRSACFRLQNWLRSGLLSAEADNAFGNPKIYTLDASMFIFVTADSFVKEYINTHGFLYAYRLMEKDIDHLLRENCDGASSAGGDSLRDHSEITRRGRQPEKMNEAVRHLQRLTDDELADLGRPGRLSYINDELASRLNRPISRTTARKAYDAVKAERAAQKKHEELAAIQKT